MSSWAPIKGPCSGGTLVNVTGNNLHFGSTVSVTINDLPAQVLRFVETVYLVLKSICCHS